VPSVRAPVPRTLPHTLTAGCRPPRRAARRLRRRRAHTSATDRFPASPASLRRIFHRESCPLALDRVGSPEFPTRRRSPAGFQLPARRRRAACTLCRPIWIGRSRSRLTPGQTSTYRSTRRTPPADDLDPTDQIRPPRLNRAVLLKSPRVFPVSQKLYPSTLRFSYK
jgi:hypothetical protein